MLQITKAFSNRLAIINSIIGFIGVIIILAAALIIQFLYSEQYCPLCMLQRIAFINIGIALLMNLRYGNKVPHWSLVILSAIAGLAVSIRQILLHINDSVGFGTAVLGLHLYTWCFIAFSLAIIGATSTLLIFQDPHSS
jgi:disulfide bond formation protein DsbB